MYQAGRLNSGQAEVEFRAGTATLTYDGGAQYRIVHVRASDAGLITWSARPGGPLAPRVVNGPPVVAQVGGVTITARRQYVNSDGDLRVSLRLRNPLATRRDVSARGYRSPDGHRSTAAIGSGGRTGVIPAPGGKTTAALVSAERARPGGSLALAVYDRRGKTQGQTVLVLPR